MNDLTRIQKAESRKRRSFWIRQLHQWHWISAALCLIGMILFAVTGITLNHAADIRARPEVTVKDGQLPPPLMAALQGSDLADEAPLPAGVRAWIADSMKVKTGINDAEWSDDEIYLALPRPGGDAWLTIDRGSGAVHYELTDRGWISYLNDLHKGRNTGLVWSGFLDIFAVACLVFSITGLFLLQLHAANRPTTWPIVGLGLLLPLIITLVFIH